MIKYKKLIEIMNKINSSISFQHLITTIIEAANELLDAEGASLLLLDPETEELIFDIVLSDKGEIIRESASSWDRASPATWQGQASRSL